MKLCEIICVGLLLGLTVPLWSQVDNPPSQPVAAYGTGSGTENNNNDDRMLTPPPVSGQSYPTSGTAGERSNYLRGGLSFTSGERCELLGRTLHRAG
jgi:hypothetical protein